MDDDENVTPEEEFKLVRRRKGKKNLTHPVSDSQRSQDKRNSSYELSFYRNSHLVQSDGRLKSNPNYDENITEIEDIPRFTDFSPHAEIFKGLQKQTFTPKIEEPQRKEELKNQTSVEEEPKEERTNTKPLAHNAPTYELEKFEKNALIIFNHVNIYGYDPRAGTDKDVEALEKTFKSFGFEVQVENDLKKDALFEKLKEFTSKDFTDYGCVAVVVLTHGSDDGMIRAMDQPYSEQEILNHFHVRDKPTLITKPRIVIVQACRGTNTSIKGIGVGMSYGVEKDQAREVRPYILPVESDMLLLHSSYMGKPSFRQVCHGSWLIQSLCKKIKQLSATHDLESILVEVKREVAVDRYYVERNQRNNVYDINKQMPVTTSTLIRKLYLKKFGEESAADFEDGVTDNAAQTNFPNMIFDASNPTTPLMDQCFCYLDHFEYIRDCLSHFEKDHPDDELARSYSNIINGFGEDVARQAKEEMCKLICQHLKEVSPHSKYIYSRKPAVLRPNFF